VKTPSVSGKFIRRLNRFVAEVALDGEVELVHVPNTGRMRELLQVENPVILRPAGEKRRKTRYDLWAAKCGGVWVCIDSRAANDVAAGLFLDAARREGSGRPGAGSLSPAVSGDASAGGELFRELWPLLDGITAVRREVRFGERRFDFALQKGERTVPVEVKSVNLVQSGVAMFPDAPTERGTHHVRSLAAWVKAGNEGHVLFVVQRSDARLFRPHWSMDPAFAPALAEAYQCGVGVHAVGCTVDPTGITVERSLRVDLEKP